MKKNVRTPARLVFSVIRVLRLRQRTRRIGRNSLIGPDKLCLVPGLHGAQIDANECGIRPHGSSRVLSNRDNSEDDRRPIHPCKIQQQNNTRKVRIAAGWKRWSKIGAATAAGQLYGSESSCRHSILRTNRLCRWLNRQRDVNWVRVERIVSPDARSL